ncbi:MAG: serpin family protein [Polyangiaceae bacterium]
MTSRTVFASSAALLIAAVGCSGSDSDSAGKPDTGSKVDVAQSSVARVAASAVPDAALSAAVTANNAFAVDLYGHVLTSHADGNLLTSPISATLALTMTYAGAKGDTATEMASALHFDPAAEGSVFAGQNALSQALNGRAAAALAQATRNAQEGGGPAVAPDASDYQLDMVNSVWGEQSYTWEQPFLDILAANYGTGVYQQDFEHAFDAARLKINDWVDVHTNDKIKDLLPADSLDSSTRMVLVNAIHLKLPWATAFQVEATATANFTRVDATTVSTPFMNRTDGFSYLDDGKAQLVWLPLAGNGESVVIALPHEGLTLAAYEATLSPTSLTVPGSGELVALSLPKSTFTSDTFSLTEALSDMGMERAFDAKTADFTGLCAHPADGAKLSISKVLQKTMISMQETGVEAAAATAVVLKAGSAQNPGQAPTPVPMIVNRPYLVAIVDNPTGALLMLGHIQDPSVAGGQ